MYVICSSESNLADNLPVDIDASASTCTEPDVDMASADVPLRPALEPRPSTSATPDEPGFVSPATLTPDSWPSSVVTRPQKRKRNEHEWDLVLDSIDKQLDKDVVADEAHQFGMSVAAKMRKFSDYQFAIARRDIELVLFNAQYGSPAAPFVPPMTPTITYTPLPATYTPFTAPPLTTNPTTHIPFTAPQTIHPTAYTPITAPQTIHPTTFTPVVVPQTITHIPTSTAQTATTSSTSDLYRVSSGHLFQ